VKISEMTEDDAKQFVYDAYKSAVAAHDEEPLEGGHPSRVIAGWAKLSQGRDGLPGNIGSSKEIEPTDHLADNALTEADPSTPGGNRARGKTAQDSAAAALEDLAIRNRAGYDVEGELHLARLRRGGTTSTSVAAMDRAVPGYRRLK